MGFQVALGRIHANGVEGTEESACVNIFLLQTDQGIGRAAGTKFPISRDWSCWADTGTHHVTSLGRIQFAMNSSDKSQGYFKVGETGRCVVAC